MAYKPRRVERNEILDYVTYEERRDTVREKIFCSKVAKTRPHRRAPNASVRKSLDNAVSNSGDDPNEWLRNPIFNTRLEPTMKF